VNNFYLLLAFVTGAGIAAQFVINSRLRVLLGGPVWAAVVQFVVGLLLLLAAALVTRQPAPLTAGLTRAPWWVWTGGVVGATFIFMSIVLTPLLGTTLTLATLIVGQLTAALVIDHYGLFGGTVIRMSPFRVAGVALLLLGVALIRWRSP
jgi:transporter family-2 protein